MNLINNRYRIITNLTQDRIKSSYLVSDVINNHEKIQLNIINSEFASESLINFYVNEFTTLSTINHANISKVFDFGLVHSIDNKKVSSSEYFYTNDYLEDTVKLHELITNINENEILGIFMQLCSALNYLHIRGFIYGEININNIMISHKNNEYKVSFVDLPTIEAQNQNYDQHNIGQLNFKSPEYRIDNKKTIAADIYSLGVVLLVLCKIDVHQNLNINQSILKFENKAEDKCHESSEASDFYSDLMIIVKKMTQQDLEQRYSNINKIVQDVNEIFNKKYVAYIIGEIEKLNFKTKIVGRNAEIKEIISAYYNLIVPNALNKIIFVHGEQGIGKTRLLKEIQHLLYLKKANVYASFAIENPHSKSNKALVDILKKIISLCDEEIVKRYQSELIKFIPGLGAENNIVASENLVGEKEKYRLISRVYSFIKDSTNNKPTVFIIDNAHCLDKFSLELLEYINLQNNNEQNIMIILSYNNAEFIINNKLQQLSNKKSRNLNLDLKNLNNEETAIMIQQILSMPKAPIDFGKKVYDKTYGNPLFVEETLKDFMAKKILCINKNNAKWRVPFETVDELPIASTMEQALLNQIKQINKDSYEILNTIAIFNTAISIGVIEKVFNTSKKRIEGYIDRLCSKGILIKKIEDMGFVFDFYNKVLKNLIYNRLSEEQRKVRHQFAASVLENLYQTQGREYNEELIYHLEKANDKERLVKYCLEFAEKMKSLRIMDEAISKYEKVLSLLSDEDSQNKKAEIILKIGDIHLEMGNLSTALETYKKTYRCSMNLVEVKIQVDCANKIAYTCIRRNEVEKAMQYIKKCESLLLNVEYMEGYLENKKNLVNVYTAKQDYQKVYEICTGCIVKCGNDYIKYKGLMYNNLGIMYSETSRVIEALECYRKGLSYFEEINYPEGMCRCLNNLGVIYGDHYGDSETAISYYNKIIVISQENSIIESELIALVNLATSYCDKFDYDAALKYFKDILVKSKNIELEGNIFYTYNYLSYVSLKMGNNKEAYEYHLLAQKELEQYPIQGKDISLYYQMGAEIYFGIGDIKAAYDLIKKALEIYNNDGTTQDGNSKLLLFVLEIYKTEGIEDLKKRIEYVKAIIQGYKNNTNKINGLYEVCIVLFEKGYEEEATNLFEIHSASELDSLVDIVNIKKLYLEGLICKDKDKIDSLILALDLSKKIKNKFFQWKICSAIGDYYFSQVDYFYAVNYYFEACEIIKDCTLQLPEQLRTNYINSFNMMKPFNMIKGVSNTYAYNKLCNWEESRINISNNMDLTALFDYSAFSQILSNKSFIESAQKIYSSILPEGIRNINDIITNMCEEPLKILDVITKLISSIVLSTRSLIISEGNNNEYSVVASSDGNHDITDIKLILQRVRESKNFILISDGFNSTKNIEFRIIPSGMKAIMCIPILRKNHCYEENSKIATERGNEPFKLENIKGYLYMESDRVLNNFNKESLNKCSDLTSFISFIMENYLLQISSSIDKLTGTLTRRFLEEALSENVEKGNGSLEVFSIIMFDLDDFKGVNDRFGHQTGDQVLRDVSKIVMDSIRKIDVCGRYGGEEFIVILPGTDTTDANVVAERIRQNIDNKKILGSKRELTVSVGIATYPKHGKWKKELVEKADQSLYVAKAKGKNRCQIWEDKFHGIVKGSDKLSGIVSGNVVQDSRNVLAMVELIQMIKEDCDFETKIFNALGRIIETTEAQNGMLFIVNKNEITEKFGRKIFKENWIEVKGYSGDIIDSVIKDKQGKCIIDWDSIIDYDLVTGMPNWKSVLAVPIIKSGIVRGILYLTVPIKVKEFKFEDLNFVNTLGQLLVGML
ncbi:diguanylate cyclase [Clostridium tagluense]|uniref:diguanylate cyclase n=1 Tax=Clostridium tagluense TaxID=360422 RepID=UPI001C0B8D24|nr:diguanylate cyclase [Clostridium tagluense]MBU3129379.1 diguanylate cyclase [Clostridium tagluense]MCB2310718.1 diguanylate cyclase [Clostridium tagluense]MCB2315552.1 diguanylate cyclase [Clostridium tagluense]MCB2320406.1 diguanylate cyclase [Clostridium tagluense]MCB2325311.1 diguanylate cyclase [Clostridium tagluense]